MIITCSNCAAHLQVDAKAEVETEAPNVSPFAPPPHQGELRRALVCTTVEHQQSIARALAQSDSNMLVNIVNNAAQTVEQMRENSFSIIVLDLNFDSVQQGAAQVKREISSLRPADRRRLFVVELLTTVCTADTHKAFVNSVNLVLSPADIEALPGIIKRQMRELNDLYRDFNKALDVAPL